MWQVEFNNCILCARPCQPNNNYREWWGCNSAFHWPKQLQWNLITAALRVETMLFAAFFNVFMAMGVIHGNNLQIMQLTHSTYTHFICDKKCLCSRWDISTVVKEEMLAFTRAILYKFTNYTIYRKCPFENKYFELKKLVRRQWGALNLNYLLVMVSTFVMPFSMDPLSPRMTPGCIMQK